MPFNTGYRGSVGGSVQINYTDQPGEGVPGMLAFASDINLADSVYIGETDGIAAGRGVVFSDVGNSNSLQRPDVNANLPDELTVVADFKGVVVFDEQMQSNSDGIPGWFNGRISRILRNNRNGGRIYVATPATIDHTADDVYMQIVADLTFALGEFGPTLNGVVVQEGISVADGDNTGNGVMSAITATTSDLGDRKLVCIESAINAGTFALYDSNGVFLDNVVVDVAYNANGLAFTLADGTTDFVAGDFFTITVTESGVESIMIPNAKWVTSAAAGGVAIIEFLG